MITYFSHDETCYLNKNTLC